MGGEVRDMRILPLPQTLSRANKGDGDLHSSQLHKSQANSLPEKNIKQKRNAQRTSDSVRAKARWRKREESAKLELDSHGPLDHIHGIWI